MYYEEQVIDGVLCYRSRPGGEWTPMSAERLTALVLELRQKPPAPVPVVVPQLWPVMAPHPTWVPETPWRLPYEITCRN